MQDYIMSVFQGYVTEKRVMHVHTLGCKVSAPHHFYLSRSALLSLERL